MTMHTYTTSEACSKLFKLVEETNKTHEPIYIKHKSGDAVLLSREDYEPWQETLYLYSIPGLVSSILKAATEKLEVYTQHKDVKW